MNSFLASLIDRFKAKSPKLYAFIVLILGTIIYFANEGSLLGVIELEGVWAKVVEYGSTLLGFLAGSRTFDFLKSVKTKKT